MNVFVVIGGRTDWSNEGGSDFATSVIGVYSSRALAGLAGGRFIADSCEALAGYEGLDPSNIADDEFWFEIVEKVVE